LNNTENAQNASFFEKLKGLNTLGYEYDEFGNYKGKNIIYWTKWFVLLLFFLIEIAPVFVKIISPPGSYEEALEKKKETEQQIFMDNMNAKIDVADYLRQKWKEDNMK